MKRTFVLACALASMLAANAEDVIQFLPCNTEAGVVEEDEQYLSLQVKNDGCVPTLLQMYITVPEGMTLITDYIDLNPDRFDGITRRGVFTPYHTFDFSKLEDGTYMLVIYDTDLSTVKGTEGEAAQIYFETSADMKDGYYPIVIKNALLGVDGNNGIYPDSSVSYVKVGNPGKNATIDLEDYLVPSFVEAELPLENVIKKGVCENLVLTDGYDFEATTTFTATSASYSRSVANDWGTICLPYAAESDENVQFYQLKSRSENSLVFTEVESLEAGQPGVFKKMCAEGNITLLGTNVGVTTSVTDDATREGLKLVGTFSQTRVDVDDFRPSYYIKDNTFMKGVEYFTIPAFRSYFETVVGNAARARILNIVVENTATGVSEVVGTLDTQSGNIYTVNGVKVESPTQSGLYIKDGKKYYIK